MKKLNQICYAARETGMVDDPRVTYDTSVGKCKYYKSSHCFPKEPKVCGNCKWYSVQ